MRIINFNGDKFFEKIKDKETLKQLRRKIAAGFIAGFIALSTPVANKAHALSWDAVLDAVGAAVGGASAQGQNDTQRGGAASVGVFVVNVLKAGIRGKPLTTEEKLDATGRAAAAGLGAMTASKDSSKEEVAFRSGVAVLLYEGAKDAYRYYQKNKRQALEEVRNRGIRLPHESTGQTACRKVLIRVIEDGRLIQERIEERCEAQKVERGYLETPYYSETSGIQSQSNLEKPRPGTRRTRNSWGLSM